MPFLTLLEVFEVHACCLSCMFMSSSGCHKEPGPEESLGVLRLWITHRVCHNEESNTYLLEIFATTSLPFFLLM